ncbi:hypothetical protein [Neobacillus mesonae]|nr:hypothetical protein [Neobacillus mesonae]MCM3569472.1 hypothetical protein [Neobacillus mesonae]
MSSTKVHNHKQTGGEKETPRTGTWISLGVVAAVILFTYLVLFGLYMGRV